MDRPSSAAVSGLEARLAEPNGNPYQDMERSVWGDEGMPSEATPDEIMMALQEFQRLSHELAGVMGEMASMLSERMDGIVTRLDAIEQRLAPAEQQAPMETPVE
jgi:hypothetical protein